MAKCDWCGGYTSDPLVFEDYEEQFCSRRCIDEFITRGYSLKKKEGCFIATAVYGNYDHPMVQDFRFFRDFTLKKSSIGRKFISFYYKNSPSIAQRIESHSTLKTGIRVMFLSPIHWGLRMFGMLEKNNK